MKIMVLLLFLIPIFSFGQELPYKGGDIVYELNINNISLTKEDIFAKTLDFVKNTLNKGSVFIQSEDLNDGLILTRGKTAFNDKNKNWMKYEMGLAVWSRFRMDFQITDNNSTITIYDIELSKHTGTDEVYRKLTDDAAEGKLHLSGLKEGKLKEKRKREFKNKAEDINDTFYTVLALYKRSLTE